MFIQSTIQPFATHFPRADIHELLSPNILHQLIKGVFKDHLVTWVRQYIRIAYPADAKAILAEIDWQYVVLIPNYCFSNAFASELQLLPISLVYKGLRKGEGSNNGQVKIQRHL